MNLDPYSFTVGAKADNKFINPFIFVSAIHILAWVNSSSDPGRTVALTVDAFARHRPTVREAISKSMVLSRGTVADGFVMHVMHPGNQQRFQCVFCVMHVMHPGNQQRFQCVFCGGVLQLDDRDHVKVCAARWLLFAIVGRSQHVIDVLGQPFVDEASVEADAFLQAISPDAPIATGWNHD